MEREGEGEGGEKGRDREKSGETERMEKKKAPRTMKPKDTRAGIYEWCCDRGCTF